MSDAPPMTIVPGPALPPLPPRRPSPAPRPPLILGAIDASPPPLPARTPNRSPNAPPPLQLPPSPPSSPPAESPPPTASVIVTPATPPQQDSPVEARQNSLGQTAQELLPSTTPHAATTHSGAASTSTGAPVQSPTIPPLPPRPPPKAQPQPMPTLSLSPPNKDGRSLTALLDSVPPSHYFLLGLLALNLLFGRLSLPLFAGCIVAAAVLPRIAWLNGASGSTSGPRSATSHGSGGEDPAVAWVNYVLEALFPLISTDVLTPFIDLLEDALMEQVPPIVTSVRLTSASLGERPVRLTSLRPLTDQEWFANLVPPHHSSSSDQPSSKSPQRAKSTSSRLAHPSTWSSPKRPRSASASSSKESIIDPAELQEQAGRRRKRDTILRKIGRRRKREDREDKGETLRDGHNVEAEAGKQDGERRRGGSGEEELDEEDINGGQYVNLQVGMKYVRDPGQIRGWGLGMLGYFGIGVKGIGKGEIPVYIDVLSLDFTVNVRLLLSATPPFVRTGTVSFPELPNFELSAKPLLKGGFNAMELPGMKSYVQASVKEVASAFVRPAAYTLDVDRLLLGRDAAIRTQSVGVLHLIIGSARDLLKTDTMGSCDPYVSVSYSKFHKPFFSTRTIINSQNPVWEEPAFILVTADAIESGERLRLRLCDSDRFSADDALGIVEVDLAELVDTYTASSATSSPASRTDELTPERPGMRVAGSLTWAVRFCPIWQMSPDELRDKLDRGKNDRQRGEPSPEQEKALKPFWVHWLEGMADRGSEGDWLEERVQRRKEMADWFTGETERDGIEAQLGASEERPSGILQFHIHQCTELELEHLEGTYSSASSHRLSPASGRPALADVVDRTPTENPDPPSAYCEVLLNDRLVYRTRTKQVTPLPYFNAVSERFVSDWREARITFVVRDERDREHDPILGLVTVSLRDAFADRSQFTRWFPLIGGLGWGRIRLSLLWKSLDMTLPQQISGYDIATLLILSLSATDLGSSALDRDLSVSLETEADRFTVKTQGISASTASLAGEPSTPGSARSQNLQARELEWQIGKPIRLAVEYRHSCSVLITFFTRKRSGVMRKKKVAGLGVLHLTACPDMEKLERTVPIFATADVSAALKADRVYSGSVESETASGGKSAKRRISSSSIASLSDQQAPLLGFVHVGFAIRPGISRAHRRLGKRDMRFKHVYEAWEAAREVEAGWDRATVGDVLKRKKAKVLNNNGGKDGEDGGVGEESDTTEEDEGSDSSEEDDDDEDGVGEDGKKGSAEGVRRKRSASSKKEREVLDADDDEEEEEGLFSERRKHSHALHKRHKGIFQLKIARTGRFVKDKIEEKIYAAGHKDRRARGADIEVEHEGQSKL